MADVDQEHIYSWLGRSDHVLSGSDKLHDRVIKFSASPPISRLVSLLVPIKQLRDLIGHRTHATPPAVSIVDELDEGVDVRSAPATPGDNRIGDERYLLLALFHCAVGGDHESERELGFIEERVCGRNSVYG